MKKENTKRILALFLAIVFTLSTCFTVSPYCVMAEPGDDTEYLYVRVENVDSGKLINGVELGTMTLTVGGKNMQANADGKEVLTEIEYTEDMESTLSSAFSAANYTGTVKGTMTSGKNGENILSIAVQTLIPNLGEIQGSSEIETMTSVPYSLSNSVWNNKVTWSIDADQNTAEASVVETTAAGCKVKATKGTLKDLSRSFKLTATAGSASVEKTVNVTRIAPSLTITTDSESGVWSEKVQVSFNLIANNTTLNGEKINYSIDKGGLFPTNGTLTVGKNATVEFSLKSWVKKVKINASYDGNDTYAPVNTIEEYTPDKDSKGTRVTFNDGNDYSSNNPLELTYGTQAVTKEITLSSINNNQNIEETVSSVKITNNTSNSPVSVQIGEKNTLIFTPENACTEAVEVELELESDNYIFKKTLYVKVNPYPLTIESASVAGDGTKIYDGQSYVNVDAELTAGDDLIVDSNEKAIFSGKVTFYDYDSRRINVDEDNPEQKFDFAPENLSYCTALENDIRNNYTISTGSVIKDVSLVIKKRTLNLTVGDASRPFRSLDYKSLDNSNKGLQNISVNVPDTKTETGFVGKDWENYAKGITPNGFTFPTVVDTTVKDDVKEIKTEDTAVFGENLGVLDVASGTGNPTGNYTFNYNVTKGNLTITGEEDASGYVKIDNNNSTNAFETADGSRFFGNDAKVCWEDFGGGYTNLYLVDSNGETTEVTGGLNLGLDEDKDKEYPPYSSLTEKFRLTKEDEKTGQVIYQTEDFYLVFTIDSTCPEVESSYSQVNNDGKFANKEPVNGRYYANSNVTYSFTVTERFLKEVAVIINGEAINVTELNDKDKRSGLGIENVTLAEIPSVYSEPTPEDDKEYQFEIVFAEDGDYTVQAVATDAAGNTGSDDEFYFTIDRVCPELEVTYIANHQDGSKSVLDPSKGCAYADESVKSITVEAVIREKNFDPAGASLEYTAENSKGVSVDVQNFAEEFCGKKNEWKDCGPVSDSDTRKKMTLTFSPIETEANYKFIYNYTDLAGNTLQKEISHDITLDRTKPTGSLTADDLVNGSSSAKWETLLNAITFGYFGKNSIRISMESDDVTAGVASTQYLVSAAALTMTDLEKRTDWKDYDQKALIFKASQHLVIYGKITDKAGNIQYISTDGIIVDNVDPVPVVKITPTTPGWGKGVYSAKDNPGFNVTVTDPIVNDTYAGLKKITYKIVNGTNGTTETGTLAELSKAAHKQQWTGHVTIDPNKFYSNDVQVTVYAEDWSTNGTASEKISIKVDNKAPVVKFTFDKGDVHNGKYYQNDKKLTITVDERNFDASYMPKVTSSAGGGYKIGQWTHNGETHTAVITFTGDSDYTVIYDCYDLAGNKSNTEKLDEFTVDKTVPVIKVAYDNNSVLNNSYYKAARTATITVTEHNFDPGQINVNTTASSGGAPKIGGWTSHGDTHTAKVSFAHDADYTFSVGGLDLAGNKAADYGPDKFTVDLTAPEITIAGVEDKSANNGTVAPVITIKDTNFIASGAEVTLTGVNTGEKNVKSMASINTTATGMTVKFNNFASGMDDIYTLSCKSVDKAGNETVVSIRFSVNRDGSTYEIDKETQKLLDKGYTNKPQDIVITEINTDILKLIEISYSLDGKIVTLKQGTDYTIESSGGEGQWKKYIYKINAACFEAEGAYVVNIYSEDAANNTTTNKSKAKTVAFTVDKSAPTMVVANLSDGGRYKEESHQFTLNARDNILLAYVELYLDGELVHTYESDELTAANGELLIEIGSSNQYQTIELISCDKAGNISKEVYDAESDAPIAATYKVLVTANGFVQYINNTPLFVGSILLALLVIFFIIILIKRRRKDEEQSKTA